MKHNAVIVLKSLFAGIPVKVDNEDWYLSDDNNICVKRVQESAGEKNDVYLKIDISLSSFINMCDKMSDDDVYIISSNKVLNEINIMKM